jgi:hypothetical protein
MLMLLLLLPPLLLPRERAVAVVATMCCVARDSRPAPNDKTVVAAEEIGVRSSDLTVLLADVTGVVAEGSCCWWKH